MKRSPEELDAARNAEKAKATRELERADRAAFAAMADAIRLETENASLRAKLEATESASRAEVTRLRGQVEELEGRRREMRQLLHRMVKYVVEDRAKTRGVTRLARLTEQVRDYLSRTADPRDILRATAPLQPEREEGGK